jgi:hypothetical protein
MSDRPQVSIDREEFYDKEVAPMLAILRDKCVERGLNFLAFVEWDSMPNGGEWPLSGRTYGKRDCKDVAPDDDQSDLMFGVNTLIKRGFLCQSITTLKVQREGQTTEMHTMIDRR